MTELTDGEISVLYEILTDEIDRDFHDPGRRDSDDQVITSELCQKVRDEAKRRRFWWVR